MKSKPNKGVDIRMKSIIDLLNSTETNLKQIIKFIQNQKNEVSKRERMLDTLKKEYNELKPIVDSKQELIQAIIAKANRKPLTKQIYGCIGYILLSIAAFFLASYVFDPLLKILISYIEHI